MRRLAPGGACVGARCPEGPNPQDSESSTGIQPWPSGTSSSAALPDFGLQCGGPVAGAILPQAPPQAAGHSGQRNWAGASVASARVFEWPASQRPLKLLHGFLDAWKNKVEDSWLRLLQASDAGAAAIELDSLCIGLEDLNAYLDAYACKEGPYFAIRPGLAEAATAPALLRMVATLESVRGLQLVEVCEAMSLTRLVAWLNAVLYRPASVCDVECLPPEVYVKFARKLHVRYEGPPSPSSFSRAASLDIMGSAHNSALRLA